ncbi:MAG: hypothetical protein O7E52_10465 [Candidatus Poribacteria bacterium]|nr:hypothetical protein [Candidatus Poribacteria bacterium]
MIRSIMIFTLVAACLGSTAFAQDSGLGLGVFFGEQTGLSLKQWNGSLRAIVGGVAWSFGDRDKLHLHADYLLHNFNVFQIETGILPLYYGLGARVKLEEGKGTTDGDNRVGVRLPVGINYIFENAPIDIFLEIVPVFDLIPNTDFEVKGSIGIRYFFQ